MSDPGAERRQLLDGLLTWVRQNQRADGDWFLDEGAPPEAPLAAPVEAVASSVPATPAAAVPSAPAPARPVPASVPAPPDSPTEAAFRKASADFVAETLETIRREAQAAGSVAVEPCADPAASLEPIRAEVAVCTACGLHASRQNTVFGGGSPRAGIVFVGEAPGADEDRKGVPFVGRSGQLLTKVLAAIGFAREDVFICNILKCRPPNNRDPQPSEVAACEGYLQRQLAIIRPRLICCLGRVAAQTLLGTNAPLGRLRRTVHFYAGIPVLATYHPAALLRNPSFKRETWDDVRKLRALHDALAAAEMEE